ncbi:MAG: ParB/RepB/Spo0J family partition protein [Chloroflexota bacterium]|nr:ParB/RepB/Spo0J family partition protein [Dehalococcoidia bacterium]MDW8255257.1 ParB/RepB/Spo0J family partition protein [Chloroflexota bacterium]
MNVPREIVYLDPHLLVPDPNVRRQEGDLRGLAATIREFGVLEPLGVRKVGDGYRLVYGNRRRAAAILAGLKEVPCIILEERAEEEYLIHQLVENMQRRQLSDMEQAEGLALIRRRMAQRDPRLSESELDERVGRLVGLSARSVQRYLQLRELPAEVRDLLQDEELSVSQAQHLRLLSQPQRQIELARVAVQYDLSAAAVRDAAEQMARRRTLSALEAISLAGRVLPLPPVDEELPADEDEGEKSVTPLPNDTVGEGVPLQGRPRFIRGLGTFDDEIERLLHAVHQGMLDRAIRRSPKALERTIDRVRALMLALEQRAALLREHSQGAA